MMTNNRHRMFTLLAFGLVWIPIAAMVGMGQDGQSKEPVQKADKPTADVPRENCTTAECHADVKDYTFIHGPLFVNACDGCHRLTDPAKHAYDLVREPQQLCQFCHAIDLGDAPYVHAPLNTGDCLSCHNPHGSAEPTMLRGETYADMCKNCHDDVAGPMDSVHGPVAAGACGACHEAHTSSFPNMLNVQGRELCIQCHISTEIQIESMHYQHSPAEVDCRVCHEVHASTQPALLNQEPIPLCESCHENIRDLVESATSQHAAVTSDRGCLNCHTAHASDFPRMLRANPMALCFECHDKELEGPNGRTIANMKAIIEGGHSLHGPTAQDNCVACHQIHGGGHERLLTLEFPSELYYPFSEQVYALCFSCHDRNLVLEPVTEAVTNFRNGDTNLHYVHVHKEEKGRSCRLCHDTHAGDRARHIRDEIAYGPGGWKLPIGFEPTPTGGSCAAGCHASFRYDRVNPVEYDHPEAPSNYKDDFIREQVEKLNTTSNTTTNKSDGPSLPNSL